MKFTKSMCSKKFIFTFETEEAERTGQDPNHIAACHACTDAEGNPYSPEELKALGYARERLIGEAITIASGENSAYTTEYVF